MVFNVFFKATYWVTVVTSDIRKKFCLSSMHLVFDINISKFLNTIWCLILIYLNVWSQTVRGVYRSGMRGLTRNVRGQ